VIRVLAVDDHPLLRDREEANVLASAAARASVPRESRRIITSIFRVRGRLAFAARQSPRVGEFGQSGAREPANGKAQRMIAAIFSRAQKNSELRSDRPRDGDALQFAASSRPSSMLLGARPSAAMKECGWMYTELGWDAYMQIRELKYRIVVCPPIVYCQAVRHAGSKRPYWVFWSGSSRSIGDVAASTPPIFGSG